MREPQRLVALAYTYGQHKLQLHACRSRTIQIESTPTTVTSNGTCDVIRCLRNENCDTEIALLEKITSPAADISALHVCSGDNSICLLVARSHAISDTIALLIMLVVSPDATISVIPRYIMRPTYWNNHQHADRIFCSRFQFAIKVAISIYIDIINVYTSAPGRVARAEWRS